MSGARRFLGLLRREVASLHVRLVVADLLVRLLPHLAFSSVRRVLYRAAGFRVGKGTLIGGRLQLIGIGPLHRRLRIGDYCFFTTPLFADLTADIDIGHQVTIGHHAVLITADHEFGSFWRRCGDVCPKPIVIGDGAWIAARVTVLPGARIGAGAVIGAGSLVKGTIPPHVLAAGSPARVIRQLDTAEERVAALAAARGHGAP